MRQWIAFETKDASNNIFFGKMQKPRFGVRKKIPFFCLLGLEGIKESKDIVVWDGALLVCMHFPIVQILCKFRGILIFVLGVLN